MTENAYICSPVQLPDDSVIIFLDEESGQGCEECDLESLRQGSACGARVKDDIVEEVSCFEVPPLCVEAFELRYAAMMNLTSRVVRRGSERIKLRQDLQKNSKKPVQNDSPKSKKSTTLQKSRIFRINDHFLLKNNSIIVHSENNQERSSPAKRKLKTKRANKMMDLDAKLAKNQQKRLFIGTTTTTIKPIPTEPICEDKHNLCCFWAVTGECSKNPFWMKLNCAKTCGTCHCSLGDADKCNSKGVHCKFSTTTKIITTTPTTQKPTTTTTFTPTATTTKKKYTRPYSPPANGFRRTQSTPTLPTKKTPEEVFTTTVTTTQPPTTTIPPTTKDDSCKDHHAECTFCNSSSRL
ncbi:unnamed protein product [Caenorhabditis sp. 36 PRJEB53466]|nr:unnamed protein product [Caenorhabditis sp. 36 PRJEB53466]